MIEFTQRYRADDSDHQRWAITVVRQQVMKQLIALALPNWQYTMSFQELHTTGVYTFRMTLDEIPL